MSEYNFKFIEDILSERYKNIDQSTYPWSELIVHTSAPVGWYDLIIELVQKIEFVYREKNIDIYDFRIYEIKEKYGRMRFHFRSSLIEVHDLMINYENRSEVVCENCGLEGKIRTDIDWNMCLCDDCYSLEK